MHSLLASVDWAKPWLAPLRRLSESLAESDNFKEACNTYALCNHITTGGGKHLQFIPQNELPSRAVYETYIYETGCVPTRDNLHDYFNALMWLSYPRSKRALNVLQAEQIQRNTVAGAQLPLRRGATRDIATLLDESGALILRRRNVEGGMIERELKAHHWTNVFIQNRQAYGAEWTVVLLGHALFEKLIKPYKAITAHAVFIDVDAANLSSDPEIYRLVIDRKFESMIDSSATSAPHLTPLPLAGLPGWWPNQTDAFYSDATVFRNKR